MEFLIPLAAVLLSLGGPVLLILKRMEHKTKRLALEAGGRGAPTAELEAMKAERKLLVERIENLESIVCSVDYELNQKLGRLVDEQLQLASRVGGEVAGAPGLAAGGASPTLTAAPRVAVTPPSEIVPGELLANRYRIQRQLGRGGMGAVFLADDQVLGEPVALKVISSAHAADQAALIERFKQEAAAARKVSSPFVVRIHDLGEARPGLLYLSMEYFPGRTLADLITQRGVVPLASCKDILDQVCRGLAAAHDAGVIHRDLKPQNVLVGERGAVKLIDFGLARAHAHGDGALTATGVLLGTPHYMAPEQVRGRPVDARADIYSLGALAYHLVTSKPPFTGDNAIAIGFCHLTEAPTPPRQLRPDLPEPMEKTILAALAKEPGKRPSSAEEFRVGLA